MSEVEWGSFDPQGPASAAMAELWWWMLGLGTAVFVAFAVLLAIGLFRRRGTGTGTAGDDPDAAGDDPDAADDDTGAPSSDTLRRWLVVAGVVLPAIIILVVFAATIRAMRWVPTGAPAGAMVIEVTGHQWHWEVHYPEDGITTTNELRLPVGRPISLQLTSADVIHSFWVPELGGKMDALPDGVNTLVLEADQPGQHRSQCAEFCGLRHADMKLRVVAEPAEQFESWLAGRRQALRADGRPADDGGPADDTAPAVPAAGAEGAR